MGAVKVLNTWRGSRVHAPKTVVRYTFLILDFVNEESRAMESVRVDAVRTKREIEPSTSAI